MQPTAQSPNPTILVVEDDEDDVFILKEGFHDQDYKLFTFYTDALSAITYLNSIDDDYLPKLIVTDFNLPAINGFEFVKFLRNHTRFSQIAIVVLTTSMSVLNEKRFSDHGVVTVIIKPFVYDEYKRIAGVLKEIAERLQNQ